VIIELPDQGHQLGFFLTHQSSKNVKHILPDGKITHVTGYPSNFSSTLRLSRGSGIG